MPRCYLDFTPTSDEEVVVLLEAAARRVRSDRALDLATDCDMDVSIPLGAVTLEGQVHAPDPRRPSRWECYLTDPEVEPDPSRWQTKMFWPVR